MVIFVFAGQSFGMSYGKLTGHTFWSSGCTFVSCICIVRGGFFVFEIVITFGLVYTVYVTAVDPKKGDIGITSPLAIGQIARANVLVWSTVVHFVSAR
ncbi:unnamed protein product [Brassica rapa]|uniref:Uncharacterized protein n=2 Tax=Brassica TaxID=3705 RepID=A0A8D9M189_BRACM|nr:unnamed protein product [Brassica napus]CAG7894072.1 unnamed protein product [Brassica rapa]